MSAPTTEGRERFTLSHIGPAEDSFAVYDNRSSDSNTCVYAGSLAESLAVARALNELHAPGTAVAEARAELQAWSSHFEGSEQQWFLDTVAAFEGALVRPSAPSAAEAEKDAVAALQAASAKVRKNLATRREKGFDDGFTHQLEHDVSIWDEAIRAVSTASPQPAVGEATKTVTCECERGPREIVEHEDAGVRSWKLARYCTECLTENRREEEWEAGNNPNYRLRSAPHRAGEPGAQLAEYVLRNVRVLIQDAVDYDHWEHDRDAILRAIDNALSAPPSRAGEATEALRPFAKFAKMFAQKPVGAMRSGQPLPDDHIVYAIHTGTEWEAHLTLGDFRRALVASPAPAGAETAERGHEVEQFQQAAMRGLNMLVELGMNQQDAYDHVFQPQRGQANAR